MSYNYNITITVPKAFAALAAKVGMALDPDSGGAASWSPNVIGHDSEGNAILGDNLVVSTPCTQQFAEQVPMMLANPEILFAAVAADYAARWPDEVPPTLEECVAFCKAVIPGGAS